MKTSRKLTTLFVLAVMLLSRPLFGQDKDKQSFVGTVTDTVCGTKHMMKGMDDAQCARLCVEHGADYGLIVGSKMYTLRGNKEAIGKLAGQEARVRGNVVADTITVDSIEAAGTHK
jgi:hypothetical protein